jgi:UDP-N-acetylglucosamine pyrophosphorylase
MSSTVSPYRIFNTNNLWVSLDAMKSVVENGTLHLEIIVNPKVNMLNMLSYFCCASFLGINIHQFS